MAPGEGKRKGSEASSRERFRAPSLPPLPRPGDLTPTQLARLLGERDDLARELASQVRDEGRDLDAVAAEHGLPVIRRQLLRKKLGEALAGAKDSEVVGPVATPDGFALARIEERREPVLDPAIRQAIQQELFEKWLADTTQEAALDLAVVGTAG